LDPGRQEGLKSAMPRILIDTNVLVYVFDTADPIRQDQAALVLRHLHNTNQGQLSAQCLAEFFNATTRGIQPCLTRSEGFLHVQRWMSIYPVFPVTDSIVLEAARGVRDHNLSYFDAQLWAAARLNQIPVIFSEDFQDGQTLEGVRIVNPFTAQFNLDLWV
jgi:predicted nucleic acid-binding protein